MKNTLIIAEAGVNHNGDINLAYKLIEKAKEAGADIIKFQTFSAEKLVTKEAKKANYQIQKNDGNKNQLEMLTNLELSPEQHYSLMKCCSENSIEFLSTAFDIENIKFLSKLNLNRYKIPSGEITNVPYLREFGRFDTPVILSTGMATLGEIDSAIRILVESGLSKKQITVLHCTTEYPAPFEEINLSAMASISTAFNIDIGYSDHTNGIEIPIAAVALGAKIIEKHITLDKSLPGPDHKASLQPDEFKSMVRSIRIVEKSIGDGYKEPSPCEKKNISVTRKYIVASRKIKRGEIFLSDSITTKRVGYGISAIFWDQIIGKISNRDYQIDEPIKW